MFKPYNIFLKIKDGWGSCTNFMLSYGLKPYNMEDCEQALEISRSMKGMYYIQFRDVWGGLSSREVEWGGAGQR